MKILVNAISARQGGIVTYTRNLMRSFQQRKLDATFAVSEGFPTVEGIPTLVLRANSYSPLKRAVWEQTMWRLMVLRHNPDVLYSSANFALFFSPCPQLLLMREGGLFDPFYLVNLAPEQGLKNAVTRVARRTLMRWSERAADLIMTPTHGTRDLLVAWDPHAAGKYRVNLYGTLSDTFRPDHAIRPWRQDGTLRILYVSVYYPHKNPGVLVETIRALKRLGIDAHATITMSLDEVRAVGGSALDVHELEAGERDGLITLGRRDYSELPQLYQTHDVFVFPSMGETFGHPMAEAMSSGLPLIAADHPINREICGDAGLYHRPFSAHSICEQLMVLDQDPDLRRRLCGVGPTRVAELFKWEDHVDRLVGIFKETIETRHRR
ncbi:MAG: glycosyltransferase [Candidatus Hydrogenedens sp.]|nr:glycosyltransferase [Candidatus Hydrogenedens sp.]